MRGRKGVDGEAWMIWLGSCVSVSQSVCHAFFGLLGANYGRVPGLVYNIERNNRMKKKLRICDGMRWDWKKRIGCLFCPIESASNGSLRSQ